MAGYANRYFQARNLAHPLSKAASTSVEVAFSLQSSNAVIFFLTKENGFVILRQYLAMSGFRGAHFQFVIAEERFFSIASLVEPALFFITQQVLYLTHSK